MEKLENRIEREEKSDKKIQGYLKPILDFLNQSPLNVKRDLSSLSLGVGIYITSYGYHHDIKNITVVGLILFTLGSIGLTKHFYDIYKGKSNENPKK